MAQFAHLHLHSQYSLLDGANRLSDVISAAGADGQPAIALTDHGNLFGAVAFYREAQAAGVKPILGIEAYTTRHSLHDRGPRARDNNHLVLLASNQTGWRNLVRLTSRSFLDGFYYKPRIDRELLRKHSEGLIGLSACLKGELNEYLLSGREEEAESLAREYREILGEGNFYLELQDHGIPDQARANAMLTRIATRLDLPLVATNDCHYLRREDSVAHDVLLCIGTQSVLSDPDRLRYHGDQFYLKSAEEMAALFPDHPEAIQNSLAIAERCNVELDTDGFHLPEFPLPAGKDLDSFLTGIARDGLDRRLAQRVADYDDRPAPEIYRERLERELEIIRSMSFSGYFLIVWDFIQFAREREIPVGPGRGSAAGSVVAWTLGITDIDPLRYDLLFERFLNPERVSMPDIDIDFCMRRRGEVIQYVNEKYGRDRVAQIITFGTLAAKAVLRDVGRVMGVPYTKVDRVAKLLPDMTRSLAEAATEVPALAREVENDTEVRRIVEVGSRLEGMARHAGVHAAGVVIAPQPIQELVPLYKTNRQEVVTQWDKDVVESLGLLKMDFLGLRTLTVLDDALKLLRLTGVELDLDSLTLDDEATYELFCNGRTSGVFQFESSGMRELVRRSKPDRFEDLVAMNALYRPGALSVGMVEEYIRRKRGEKRVSYVLPETEPILEETYGVIAYQEQVMQIAVEIAGFSMGEADVLRKAMGKKDPQIMAEQRAQFVEGGEENGFERGKVEELWEYIEPFAGYGFNKSHSVAYALLAYRTAYLKTHHPEAFMAAMLSSEIASKDNVAKYVRECREMGIQVLPPDVNQSSWSFTVEKGAIRFGLGAVKGIGEGAVEAILEARRRVGRFSSLAHLAREADLHALNHKVFESLVRSGSLDSMGVHRSALQESLPGVLDYASRLQREEEAGQTALFAPASVEEPGPDPGTPPWTESDRLRYEKETLGFYLTGHPLSELEGLLARRSTHTTADLAGVEDGTDVRVGGLVAQVSRSKIKSGPNAGRLMARVQLEDLHGRLQVAVFADQFERCARHLNEDAVVLVEGAVRQRGGDLELRLERVAPLGEAEDELEAVEIVLAADLKEEQVLALRDLLSEHPGPVPVHFSVQANGTTVHITPAERFAVEYSESLRRALEGLIGREQLRPHQAIG